MTEPAGPDWDGTPAGQDLRDCERCAAALARASRSKVTVIPPEDPEDVRRRDKADIDKDLANLRDTGYSSQYTNDVRRGRGKPRKRR